MRKINPEENTFSATPNVDPPPMSVPDSVATNTVTEKLRLPIENSLMPWILCPDDIPIQSTTIKYMAMTAKSIML